MEKRNLRPFSLTGPLWGSVWQKKLFDISKLAIFIKKYGIYRGQLITIKISSASGSVTNVSGGRW